ncbi:Ger(x)C family spore germination protein [Cohnella thailandensis]|uniref:Ger(X)C family spore germination protein n=1 Tax=Cohnella thailandensis TaxID=557557 RepID=A0A841SXT2_9BACL|nr:Ger(x)C family spore germination protein [Cohnella thailandensis]MBB6637043.1 Ger(x)C family spore germination protein [Cohnella thailandensis]MBP1973073.1 spore germination protein KC [Cohnella thailandensis]
MLIVPIFTGCWDRRELNELGISMAMGIDKAGDEYRVSIQVVQPGAVAQKTGGGIESTPVSLFESKGVTIFEALRRMTNTSPRKIYSAHLRFVVFGEEMAREGIGDTLDLLSRDNEFRKDFYLLVAKGTTAASLLSILTPLEKIPANKIYRSIDMSEKSWAPTTAVTLDDFIEDMASKGKQPVLGVIEVLGDGQQGNSPKSVQRVRPSVQIRTAGLAAFRDDKLIGWLNEEESIGYNFILNKIKSMVDHVACPAGGNVALETTHSKAEIKGRVAEGRARLKIKLNVEQNVGEVQCRLDLTQPDSLDELERLSQKSLEELVYRTLEKVQTEYKADIFGFGSAIHRSAPKSWRTVMNDWEENFEHAQVDVDATVRIKRNGTITNPITEEKGET